MLRCNAISVRSTVISQGLVSIKYRWKWNIVFNRSGLVSRFIYNSSCTLRFEAPCLKFTHCIMVANSDQIRICFNSCSSVLQSSMVLFCRFVWERFLCPVMINESISQICRPTYAPSSFRWWIRRKVFAMRTWELIWGHLYFSYCCVALWLCVCIVSPTVGDLLFSYLASCSEISHFVVNLHHVLRLIKHRYF